MAAFSLRFLHSRAAIRDSSYSFLSSVGSFIVSLIWLKAIALLIPAAEYGTANLALGVAGLITFVVQTPVLNAQTRHFFDREDNQSEFFGEVLTLALVQAAIVVVVYLLFAGASFHASHLYLLLSGAVALYVFAQALSNAGLLMHEVRREYRRLAGFNLLIKILQIPALVILLFLLRPAIATISAQGVAGFATFFLILLGCGPNFASVQLKFGSAFRFFREHLKDFGFVYYLGFVAGWTFTTSDRYILQASQPLSSVGVYVLNYSVWSMPYLLLNSWLETSTRARIYAAAAAGENARTREIVLFRILVGFGLACAGTLLIGLLGPRLAPPLMGQKYWYGNALMLLLSSAHICYVVGSTYVAVLLAYKRTARLLAANAVGAVLNLVLNALLIPRYGILAAGAVTLISYAAWLFALWLVTQKFLRPETLVAAPAA
jgi:O-antigen/teichoic acid export membrane protein